VVTRGAAGSDGTGGGFQDEFIGMQSYLDKPRTG
jgi:hypothetical protein